MTEAGLLDAAELDAIEREVEEATLAGLAAAPPDPAKTLTRDVYKTYA